MVFSSGWRAKWSRRLAEGSTVVETTAGRIEYQVHGTGPAILALHGRQGGYDMSRWIADRLVPDGYRRISVSRPGYLRSPLDTGPTPDRAADVFAALLDAIGVSRTVALGFSAGGPSTIQFAIRHPDRCRALVLVSAVTKRRPQSDKRLSRRERLIEHLELSDVGTRFLDSLSDARFGSIIYPFARDPAQLSLLRSLWRTSIPPSLREPGFSADGVAITNLEPLAMREIRCPTLIIQGTSDGFVGLDHAQHASASIPGAELMLLEGGGHLAAFSDPAARARIEAFLKQHAADD